MTGRHRETVLMSDGVDPGVVAEEVGVLEGVADGAETVVGQDASVVSLVRTFPVRSTLLAGVASPAALADANVLKCFWNNIRKIYILYLKRFL